MPYERTPEHRKRMAAMFRGRTLDPEWRSKISKARKGHRHSAETRRKMSLAAVGRRHSEDTKRRIGASNIGKHPGPLSPAHRDAISRATRGKPHSKDHNERMRAAVTGLKKSTAHRAKMSASMSEAVMSGRVYPNRAGLVGRFYSKKNGCRVHHRSLLERRWFKKFEMDVDVVSYRVECLSIPYEWGGCRRYYTPDVLVTMANGSRVLFEIKPENRRDDDRCRAKWKAARGWCRKRNVKFVVVGYKELQ